MSPALLLAGFAIGAAPALAGQTDIAGPPGSGRFGTMVKVLPNGNFVVTDPAFDLPGGPADVGAVYLYDSEGQRLSTLTGSWANDRVGSGGVTVLANSHFVVSSIEWHGLAGAVTWGSSTAGVGGSVGAHNSLVGTPATASQVGSSVVALPDGHYVVASPAWSDGKRPQLGAVTWGDGAAGARGVVSAANSKVGTTAQDRVGVGGITVLEDGNYLICSATWTDPVTLAPYVGAATWVRGGAQRGGPIGAHDSLVGATAYDQVGSSVVVLQNGNYVVHSPGFRVGPGLELTGASTWGDRRSGVAGVVSADNSLVGSSHGDRVSPAIALANGNYVVSAPGWRHTHTGGAGVGAVTWGDGRSGVRGAIGPDNSLVGSSPGDNIGQAGVFPLSDGNYVVASHAWDHAAAGIEDAGAATWGDGRTGLRGTVSPANSLVGGKAMDHVALAGVFALPGGHYVIASPDWNDPQSGALRVGAATWVSGGSPATGVVSAHNSLVGSRSNDRVGHGPVDVLANGNYVVRSRYWNDERGAVTWGDGRSGTTGVVTIGNSLVGGSTSDLAGVQVHALSNGHYVVAAPGWRDPRDGGRAAVGAVTWGDGRIGVAGAIGPHNSLVGRSAHDAVGTRVTVLPRGGYLVSSPYWDAPGIFNAGALTWLDGSGPVSATPDAGNSLVGGWPDDRLGLGLILVLPDGGNVVDILRTGLASTAPVGPAVTLAPPGGLSGPLHSGHTVTGQLPDLAPLARAYDDRSGRLVVGRPADNMVTLLERSIEAVFANGFE